MTKLPLKPADQRKKRELSPQRSTLAHMKWLQRIPAFLSRTTSSGRYLPEVDGFRFVAIMPVLIQHLSERLQRYSDIAWAQPLEDDFSVYLSSRGTIGVFIFFAISGFILALPFAQHHLEGSSKPRLKTYLLRRLTRLEPPYILWMSCFFVILLMKGGWTFGHLLPHYLASIVYLHNLTFLDYSAINPVAWSLEIEVQFYLLAPLLTAIFFRQKNKQKRRILLIGSIFLLLLLQNLLAWHQIPYKFTLLWHLHHFLVGFLVADFYLTDWKNSEKKAWWLLDVVAVLAFFTLCFTWSDDFWKRLIFTGALLILFVAGFRGKFFPLLLKNAWIAAIGGMCYTIYLIHLPLMEGLIQVSHHLVWTNIFVCNLILQFIVVIPVVLSISAVGYLLFEKPFMDKYWPEKWKARWNEWRYDFQLIKK
ncbi:MAG TPA: acyltransferase [Saprospiraceae bacterium]|nr:acyltransferase [Saprospiraceae bacterium]HMQ85108.1 acyltransferase [Saprospiraceae bacterium]